MTPAAMSIGARMPSTIIFRTIEGPPWSIRCLPTSLRPLLVWGSFALRIRHLGGSLAKNRGQEGTAGEHEEIAKYDCGRPARPVVKMHEVDDPGDDQGKAAEKAAAPKPLITKPPMNITGLSVPFRGFSSCSFMSSDHR
jgi:hypothetical protein